ncbi:MAG: FAD-dependent oxidoreductase [Chloroflexi bacterium]|nr:FAD-dependent oxidoreductase [Chloroflexota bacterium]
MRVGIIGGGVAGMVAAYRLSQQGHQVGLYEASPFLGGLVRTFDPGGDRLEAFYHHLFSTDTTIIKLIEELGLGDKMTWRTSKVGFYREGKLYDFVTATDLLKYTPAPLLDRVRMGLAALYLRRQADGTRYESITAADWIKRYMGKGAYDTVWGPLLRGKFGDAHDQLAMVWLWSKVHLRFASRKGVSQTEELGYLLGSFGTYIEELERRLIADENVEVHTATVTMSHLYDLRLAFNSDICIELLFALRCIAPYSSTPLNNVATLCRSRKPRHGIRDDARNIVRCRDRERRRSRVHRTDERAWTTE